MFIVTDYAALKDLKIAFDMKPVCHIKLKLVHSIGFFNTIYKLKDINKKQC